MLIGRRHALVSELNRCQFETASLPQILARRPAERMESVCARRALDATPVENRIEHFPSQMIWVMWTRILIGSTKHEIIGADIFRAFKMLHQDTVKRFRRFGSYALGKPLRER